MADFSEIIKRLSVQQIISFWPLLTSNFLSAFYSALLLKQNAGVQITPEIQRLTLEEVLSKWDAINQVILQQIPSLRTGSPPEKA